MSSADHTGPHARRATGCGNPTLVVCLRVFCFEMPNVSATSLNPSRCLACIHPKKTSVQLPTQVSYDGVRGRTPPHDGGGGHDMARDPGGMNRAIAD